MHEDGGGDSPTVSEGPERDPLAGFTPAERNEAILVARTQRWRAGDLTYKLDRDQRADSVKLWSRPREDFVAAISRQRGKSFWACCEAIGFALRKPGSRVCYVSLTQKSVHSIIEPQFRTILEDCPDDLRPTLNQMRGIWEFKNGSQIAMSGTDGKQYERLRGTKAHFIVKDEAAFFSDYEEVDAVLSPQTLTTGGIALEISTPPETPGHPFEARFRAALGNDRGVHRPIYGHPRMSSDEIEWFIAREASKKAMTPEEFKQSTYFRREFLAEFVTEETRAVVPGWTQERERELVRQTERPEFFDGYVGLDLGFGDPHAVLFGYLDFASHRLVIEDELLMRGANTEKLANAIKEKETAVWGADRWEGTLRGSTEVAELPEYLRESASGNAPAQPYLRVGDNDPLALADLQQKHRITFLPTAKDEKHLQLDMLDILVRRGELAIHPRCKNLIRQLYVTIWNRTRTQYERINGEHGDLIDALVYMVRNVRWHRDPRPANYGVDRDNQYIRPRAPSPFSQIMTPKKRK